MVIEAWLIYFQIHIPLRMWVSNPGNRQRYIAGGDGSPLHYYFARIVNGDSFSKRYASHIAHALIKLSNLQGLDNTGLYILGWLWHCS
jgi:hypothetical protein